MDPVAFENMLNMLLITGKLRIDIDMEKAYGPYGSGDGVKATAWLTLNGVTVAESETDDYISVEKA